jgi:hypothetical protein
MFSIHGSLQLDDATSPMSKSGIPCAGSGGYDDIDEGAQVTVTDQAGTVLAVSRLISGVTVKDPEYEHLTTCMFSWSVLGVPAGRGPYGIEVAHRGVLHYDEARLRAEDVTLTLGR